MSMNDETDNFHGTTAVTLDGRPIQGDMSGAVVSTTTGHRLFEFGIQPDSNGDLAPDWRDRALLHILAHVTGTRLSEDEIPDGRNIPLTRTAAGRGTNQNSQRDLLTTSEAASYLRHSTTWLLKQCDIPYIKGTPNLYRRADLDDWAKRHTLKPMGV